MDPTASPARHDTAGPKPRGKLAAVLTRVAHNPVQLRAVLTVVIFGGWYWWLCVPYSEGIDDNTRRASRARDRLTVTREVERLRAQADRFKARLPEKSDPNAWVQYVLAGVRGTPLKLVMLDTDGTREVGPYRAVVMKMTVSGTFGQVDEFLRWLESNERLLRVDALTLTPSKDARTMDASLVVLGLMG